MLSPDNCYWFFGAAKEEFLLLVSIAYSKRTIPLDFWILELLIELKSIFSTGNDTSYD